MRVNRLVRNKIESKFGIGIVDEIGRYNDSELDSLEEFGVELSPAEEQRQFNTIEKLAREERARRFRGASNG